MLTHQRGTRYDKTRKKSTPCESCRVVTPKTLYIRMLGAPWGVADLDQLVVHERRRHVHARVPVPIAGVDILGEGFKQDHHVYRARLKQRKSVRAS